MIETPKNPDSNRVARSRRATLASLLVGGIFFAALFLVLNAVVRRTDLSESIKVMALVTLAIGLLVFALALVGDYFIRNRGWHWDSPLLIAIWAYIVPGGYFLCMCLAYTVFSGNFWHSLLQITLALINRFLILLFWQVLMLAWFLLRVKRVAPGKVFTIRIGALASAGLAGLGLGLGTIFILSIESNLIPSFPSMNVNPVLAPAGRVMVLLFMLTLLPWAEENYFRGILFDWLGERLGEWGTVLMSALLFTALSFRLNLFLPGLLLGVGLGVLRKRTSVEAAIFAHAVCNLVILGLFPMIAV
jgi:membrane protease YdiL (CAAX protease family)